VANTDFRRFYRGMYKFILEDVIDEEVDNVFGCGRALSLMASSASTGVALKVDFNSLTQDGGPDVYTLPSTYRISFTAKNRRTKRCSEDYYYW